MPCLRRCGFDPRVKDNAFRARLIETLQDAEALDLLFHLRRLTEKPV